MLTTTTRPTTAHSRRRDRGPRSLAKARRASRPALEGLDGRCLLSIGATFDGANGILTINSDGYNTKSNVTANPTTRQISIWDDYYQTRPVAGATTDSVKKIVFRNNAPYGKTVDFENRTSIDADFHTGASDGSFNGGGGTNRFYPGVGAAYCNGGSGVNYFYDVNNTVNDYNLGTGDNVLYLPKGFDSPGASHLAFLQNPKKVTPRSQVTVTPDAPGGLRYGNPSSLDVSSLSNSMIATLAPGNKSLRIAGPTGGGFRLFSSSWTTTFNAGAQTYSFKPTSGLYLETGIRDGDGWVMMPIVPGGTNASSFSVTGRGTYATAEPQIFAETFNFGSASLQLDSDSSNPASSLGGLGEEYGFSFDTAGASWGLKLGSDLLANNAAAKGMPLLYNVPYFYASASTGSSMSFGDNTSAGTSSKQLFLALDPSDPALFAKIGTDMATPAIGVSLQGAIPYRPEKLPDGVSNPRIYGHLYTSAADVGIANLPLAFSGSTVFDFDANDDGKVSLSKDNIKAIFGGDISKVRKVLDAAAVDLAIGFNGSMALDASKYGVSLNAQVASGSGFYEIAVSTTRPNTVTQSIGFRASTDNPFAGTKLESISLVPQMDIGGFVTRTVASNSADKYDWGFSAYANSCTMASLTGSELSIEASSATGKAEVSLAFRDMVGFAKIGASGSVDLKTGDFNLRAYASASADLGFARGSLGADFSFAKTGSTFEAKAILTGYGRIGNGSSGYIEGGFTATVYIGVSGSRWTYGGSGDVWLAVQGPEAMDNPITGWIPDRAEYSVHVGVNQDGISVSLGGYRIRYRW